MICPICLSFMFEKDLVKSKIKKWQDIDIEYEARCPACGEYIGKMYWGKIQLRPDLVERYGETLDPHDHGTGLLDSAGAGPVEEPYFVEGPYFEETPEYGDGVHEPGEYEPGPDNPSAAGGAATWTMEQMSGHYCPHCGGDLPNDINLLPRRFTPKF